MFWLQQMFKASVDPSVQDAAVACAYYIFLCRFLRTQEPQTLVGTLEREVSVGCVSDRWSVFQHKHKQKLASCGTPSFLEGNVIMHEQKFLNRLQALDFTAARIASYTNGASSQAGNQGRDSTPSFTQHSTM